MLNADTGTLYAGLRGHYYQVGLTRKAIRRGDFCSVEDLEDKIIAFIEYHNAYLARPYAWTYTDKPLATNQKAA